jgi:hypothetical protein
MSAAKTPDENFIQEVGNEMTTQADRSHQLEMQIRKHKLLTERIETQQRLNGTAINQSTNRK